MDIPLPPPQPPAEVAFSNVEVLSPSDPVTINMGELSLPAQLDITPQDEFQSGQSTEISQTPEASRWRQLGSSVLRVFKAEALGTALDAFGMAAGVPTLALEGAGGATDAMMYGLPEVSKESSQRARVAKQAGFLALNIGTGLAVMKYGPEVADMISNKLSRGATGDSVTIASKVAAVKGVNKGVGVAKNLIQKHKAGTHLAAA